MNKPIEKKRLISILLVILFSLMSSAAVVYAAVLFSFRVKGDIGGNTDVIDQNGSLISLETQTENIAFSAGNTEHTIPLTVSNKSSVNAVYDFGMTVTKNGEITDDDFSKLKSSILVSLDGKFIGTLAELTNAGEGNLYNGSFYLGSGSAATPTSASHTLALSLHIAADPAAEEKTFVLRVNTYVRNADYRKVVFVKTENEFKKAADDLNSGLSDVETIVLAGDVTLGNSYSLNHPVSIDLSGHKLTINGGIKYTGNGKLAFLSSGKDEIGTDLTGTVTVNNAGSYLDVAGKTESGLSVTLTSFNIAEAKNLVTARAGEILQGQAEGGEKFSLFGALSFYNGNINVTASNSGNYTLSGTEIEVKKIDATKPDSVTIGGDTIEFKIIGNSRNDSVFASLFAKTNGELRHIPTYNNATGAITYDLFLPVYIENKNVKIEWTSSDPSSIGNDGKLADTLNENVEVTLYARITVNEETYLHSFTFKVTSQTRETKFKYLVAQLSPITLRSVYKNDADKACLNTELGEGKIKTPYVYLPVVSANGYYDYRKNFHMSHNGDGAPIEAENWARFRDIGLTNITYKVQNAYNFISLDTGTEGIKAVYLNTATFYTFAQIDVTGDFGFNSSLGKNETYEATVNVLIELGSNSDLYDLAIDHVEKQASEIDILQNILDTRVKYGMGNERGDFYLPSVYQTIAISYSKIGNAVSKIEPETENGVLRYHFYINAEEFLSSESSVGIKVTVKMSGDQTSTGQSRNIYVNAPAVIKPDENGFSNYSVFSSAKYQTFNQLADYEKADSSAVGYKGTTDPDATARAARLALLPTGDLKGYSTGFVIDGETITNKTGDYILVRDAEQEGVKNLSFKVGNSPSASESHKMAYQLAQLLEWATSTKKKAIPFTVGSYTSENTQSNGKDYMNDTETAVVKAYLGSLKDNSDKTMFSTADLSGDSSSSLWNRATRKPDGDAHVIEDYTKIITNVKTLLSNNAGLYFKYTEVMQWALNEKKFENADGSYTSSPPNLGYVGIYNIAMDADNSTNYSSRDINWQSDPTTWRASSSGGWGNSKYNTKDYLSDGTDYISDREAQVIIAFWWGADGSSNKTKAKNFARAFLKACTIPTYLNGEGSGLLISEIYKRYGENGSFSVGLAGAVPVVSNMDNSSAGIDFYKNLTSFEVYGEVTEAAYSKDNIVKLPAFITSEAVNNCFNRVTNTDAEASNETKLKKLVMQACANKSAAFDLKTISRLSSVTDLDFSYNEGISTLGDLLNVDIKKIKYLDVFRVNVEDAFVEYVLRTIKSNAEATIYYADPNTGTTTGNRIPYTNKTNTSDALRYLNELTKVDSPYLQLAKKSYTGAGSSSTIQWYLQSGNPAFLVSDPGSDQFTEINSAQSMQSLLANYYFCKESINTDYGNLEKNNVYKLNYNYNNGSFIFEKVNVDSSVIQGPSPDATELPDSDWANSIKQPPEYSSEKLGESNTSGTVTLPEQTYTTDQLREMGGEIIRSSVSNKYIDVDYIKQDNSKSEAWYQAQNGLYHITKTVDYITTQFNYNVKTPISTKVLYYENTGIINSSLYSKVTSEYIPYYITEKRVFDFYYVETATDSGKWQLLYNQPLTFSTYNGQTVEIDLSNYEFVYSNKGQTTDELKIMLRKGTVPYYTTVFTSSCDKTGKTISKESQGTITTNILTSDKAQSLMEDYLKSLYEENQSLFTAGNDSNHTKSTDIYFNYLTEIGNATDVSSAVSNAEKFSKGFWLYRYTGNTRTIEVYTNGIPKNITYTENQGYRYRFDKSETNSGFSFTEYTLHIASNSFNMEAILAEANTHIEDELFGNYYGNYYCYDGTTATINGIRTYTNGNVYRLVLSEDGTQFVFDNNLGVKSTFATVSSVKNNDNTTSLFYNLYCAFMENNAGIVKEGQIVYCKGTGETYAIGFYELVYNEISKTYYFKSMGALGNVTQTAYSFSLTPVNGRGQDLQKVDSTAPSRFKNIRHIGTSGKNYGGTGGSEEVVIVARVIETVTENDGTVKKIYERPFKVTVSG